MKTGLLRSLVMGSVAAGALCVTASAYTVAIGPSAGTTAGAPTNGIDTVAETSFASEIAAGTQVPAAAQDDLVINVSPNLDGSFPSGNTILKITLANGQFSDSVTNASVITAAGGTNASCGAGFSAAISSGGATGSSEVTFVLSDANTCLIADGITITLPVRVTTVGASATLTTDYRTDGNNPIEGGAGGPVTWATFGPAFNLIASAAPDLQTSVSDTPVYSKLGGNPTGVLGLGVIGSVDATKLYPNLTAPVAADVNTVNIKIDGSTAHYVTTAGVVFSTPYGVVGDLDVIGGAFQNAAPLSAADADAFFASSKNWSLNTDGGSGIAASTYSAAVNATFTPSFLANKSFTLGPALLADVVRDGWSATATWVTDDTRSNGEVIRLIATATTAGPVRIQLLQRSATGLGTTGATVSLGNLVAGQELIIDKAKLLTAFGNGYAGSAKAADFLITAEAANDSIIAQRLIAVPGFGLTWVPLVDCTGNNVVGGANGAC